jgi:hypothetical protein
MNRIAVALSLVAFTAFGIGCAQEPAKTPAPPVTPPPANVEVKPADGATTTVETKEGETKVEVKEGDKPADAAPATTEEKPAATEEKPAATEEKPAATEEKKEEEKPAATEEKKEEEKKE